MTNRVPDWLVERLVSGDLDEARAAEVRARLGDGLEARVAELQASNAQILQTFPAARVIGEARRRHGREVWRRRAMIAAPAMALAAVILAMVTVPRPISAQAIETDTRSKGHAHLVVHRRRGERVEVLGDGAVAHPGDLIQLSYVAGTRPYGAIVSIDGRGGVTLHAPPDPAGEADLDTHGEVALPEAWQLDDAPGFERFFFVTSDHPLPVATIVDAAQRLADSGHGSDGELVLPPGVEQQALRLQKEPQ